MINVDIQNKMKRKIACRQYFDAVLWEANGGTVSIPKLLFAMSQSTDELIFDYLKAIIWQ